MKLKTMTEIPIWFKPNAGAPVSDGEGNVHYSISPDGMGLEAQNWVKIGATFVGGCCGTSPEHLGAIAKSVR